LLNVDLSSLPQTETSGTAMFNMILSMARSHSEPHPSEGAQLCLHAAQISP
jgi:hypothetical protein